jgi:hypothetical protein
MRHRWQGRRLPGATHTDPDVRFSRIRFLGCTRLRADLHSYPLQDPVAIPRSEVCSCLSSPTCPTRVSFASCVLPSGPSPCGWLSQPLSTMPDKTPRRHITALRQPTWIVDYPRQEPNGTSRVLRRLSSCMPRPDDPADLHILAKSDAFVLPSRTLKPSASASCISKLCQHFRKRGLPYGLQDSLPTLNPSC